MDGEFDEYLEGVEELFKERGDIGHKVVFKVGS
jgi:hypothetical protein